jgi:hypothetical protein
MVSGRASIRLRMDPLRERWLTRERPISMRTIRHTILLPLLATAMAGCASPETTRREMASWEGRPVKELIAAWGVPDRQQMFEGKRFYTWVWRGAQGSVAVPDVSTQAGAPTRGMGYHMSRHRPTASVSHRWTRRRGSSNT